MNLLWWEILLRLLAATAAGAILGLERESTGKPAGLRTMTLICLGSALFMILSLSAFPQGSTDLSRVAAGVVTGVGFLGAGAIFREGVTIRGLTTAATIWVVCALGLAIGAGLFFEAGLGLVIALLALVGLRQVEGKVPKKRSFYLTLTIKPEPSGLNTIFSIFKKLGLKVEDAEAISSEEGVWKFSLHVPKKVDLEELLQAVSKESSSFNVTIEEKI